MPLLLLIGDAVVHAVNSAAQDSFKAAHVEMPEEQLWKDEVSLTSSARKSEQQTWMHCAFYQP